MDPLVRGTDPENDVSVSDAPRRVVFSAQKRFWLFKGPGSFK